MTSPEVSLVVLNWNSGRTIFECIDSLIALRYADREIVVFDNGSTDGSAAELEHRRGLRLIRSETNLGFAGGHVAALQHCRGRYIGLVNADAVLSPEWLDVLVGLMQANPDVGAAGGRLYNWEHGRRADAEYLAYQAINPYTGDARTLHRDGGQVCDVGSVSAAAVVVSRRALEAVGYFDLGFFAYYEETDLFARMIRAGFRIVYSPSARAWHERAAALGETSFRYNYLVNRNRFRFAVRNFDRPYLIHMLRRWLVLELQLLLKLPLRHTPARMGRAVAAGASVAQLPRNLAARRRIVARGTYNAVVRRLHQPTVSVIVARRHGHGSVLSAVASACTQTVPALEVIVVHASSSSSSDELDMSEWHPRPVQVVGPSGSFAAKCAVGAARARGEWLVFLDECSCLAATFVEDAYDAWLRRGDPDTHIVSPAVQGSNTKSFARPRRRSRPVPRGGIVIGSLIHRDMFGPPPDPGSDGDDGRRLDVTFAQANGNQRTLRLQRELLRYDGGEQLTP